MNQQTKKTKSAASIADSQVLDSVIFNRHRWQLLILSLAVIISYITTLGHGFVLDDPLAIGLNENVTRGFGGIIDIITGGYRANDFGGQLYRPIALIQFAIEWGLSPNNPAIHHFFNILYYLLLVWAVYFLVNKWAGGQKVLLAFGVALVFAVHPLHTEVVANIKSRDEIMALLFVILSFVSYDYFQHSQKMKFLFTSLGLFFLASISKESAVTMFPVFGLLSWFVYQKDIKTSFTQGLIFLIPVIIVLMIRKILFGVAAAPAIDIMDNAIVSKGDWWARFPTSLLVLWQYFKMMIQPYPLSYDYSFGVMPILDQMNLTAITSLVLHIGLVVMGTIGTMKRRIFALFIWGYLLSIVLYSQLLLVIGTLYGERLAFTPSFWFLTGIGFLVFKLTSTQASTDTFGFDSFRRHSVFSIAIIIVTSIFLPLTLLRSLDWKDNFTLFTTDVMTYPDGVRLNNAAAESYVNASNDPALSETEKTALLAKAEAHCQKILQIRPVATAYLTLGNIRLKSARYEEAITYYDQVNDLKEIVDVNKSLAYREMGRIAGEKENNLPKAQQMLSNAIKYNATDAESWFLMGISYGVLGNHAEAARHFEEAYKLSAEKSYLINLLTAYNNVGNTVKIAETQALINANN